MKKITIINLEQWTNRGQRYLVLMTERDGSAIAVASYRSAGAASEYLAIAEGLLARQREYVESPLDEEEMPF